VTFDEENGMEIVRGNAVSEITRSEIQSQVEVAHQFPRSIKTFLREAKTMVTMNQEIAEACIYSLPRAGKPITGPSVRLAEIAANTYGNLQIGSRVVDSTGFSEVVAQGMAWDMERNVRIVIETRRNIQGKNGQRFTNDMIVVTGNAAASIALRNAIFRVVPKCYIDDIYKSAVGRAVGDSKTFVETRDRWISRVNKSKISTDRLLARLGRASIEDMTLEDIEILIGIDNAIRAKDCTIDEAFPVVEAAPAPAPPEQDGKRVSVNSRQATAKPATSDPQPKSAPSNTDPAITPEQIKTIKRGAKYAGDKELVTLCEQGLEGDFAALSRLTEIRDAGAQM
jgi:hypothetical protein